MARINVSVPDELKTRMDEVGEAANWSAIAQRAFSEAVATHLIRKDDTDMESVVERLRASKYRLEEGAVEAGKEAGRTWAKERAEYDELDRLATLNENHSDIVGVVVLQNYIDPEEDLDEHQWARFWEENFGRGRPNDAFARGFAEGAASVFQEVADQI